MLCVLETIYSAGLKVLVPEEGMLSPGDNYSTDQEVNNAATVMLLNQQRREFQCKLGKHLTPRGNGTTLQWKQGRVSLEYSQSLRVTLSITISWD